MPVGADAHLKYQSKTRFGAVLIARNPVTVTALNDECLFKDWVESNKPFLYSQFGRELKKYGMWVVTVTYTAPGCSINAWLNKDKEALLSAKAKASMVGDYGAQLDWTDQITDKDWRHYSGDPTKWSEKDMKQSTSQPGSTAQIQTIPKRSEQRDPTCPVTKLDIPTTKAATASPNDQQPNSAQDLDGQPASHLAMKADSSPVVDYSNLRSDTHEASAERTPPNLHPVPRPKSPSIDRRNGRHRSPSNTGVAGMKAPPTSPAKNDGVVLFFDGIRVDQVDWWIEGLKDLTSSIFVSSPTKPNESIASHHEQHLLKHISAQPPISHLPIWATKKTSGREEYSPLHISSGEKYYSDADEDYDPEKDEGVYPSDWPRKSNSLLSGRPGHLERLEGNTIDSNESNPHVDISPNHSLVVRHSAHLGPTSYYERDVCSN